MILNSVGKVLSVLIPSSELKLRRSHIVTAQFALHPEHHGHDLATQPRKPGRTEANTHKPFPNGPSTDFGATNCSVSRGYRFLAFQSTQERTIGTGLPRDLGWCWL
ncbi:hypothetical protein QC762_0033750 [Podospora pseudocomata]|uniref:Uncharacterized protein n=1 Tax=Podospora pseudocomata TaxID=2093779 RepID=A0ABR0GQS8_9PEZI|nr:hypothetical protein QC762_0033750 [Podospora pseudocomata]